MAIISLDPNWGLFWATITLVGVTIFYAIQTWKLVKVPYRPSLMPIFDPNPLPNNGFALKLKIENIGLGIARNVKMKYYIKDNSKRITTDEPQSISPKLPLYPIEKSDLILPHRSSLSPLFDVKGLPSTEKEYYSRHKVKLKGKIECKDAFGKKHKFKTDLDVSALAREFTFPN
jgi:hypothetical protein